MEATGRDGGQGPSWTYRRQEETETISSSSRSGTIVSISTAYTSSGRASGHSSSMSSELRMMGSSWIEADKNDADLAQQPIKKPRKETGETFKEKRMKHIESLVQEFFRAESVNRSILGAEGGMSALESWFSELGVSWVLRVDVAASKLVLEDTASEIISWIRALTQIMDTIRLTESFFPDHGHGSVGIAAAGISEEKESDNGKQAATSLDQAVLLFLTKPSSNSDDQESDSEEQAATNLDTNLDPVQFARFFQEALAKMLVFVDVLFSKSVCIDEPEGTSSAHLKACLDVNGALSKALSGMRLKFHSSTPLKVERIEKEMVSLLLAKQGKAFDAIWSALEEIRTCVLKSMEESLDAQTPQGSSDIHEAICSVMNHMKLLLYHGWQLHPVVTQAAILGKYVPQAAQGEAPSFNSLVAELVSSIEEKLITKSQLFPDKGLRFLFLLNNSNFIWEKLKYSYILVYVAATRKVEHYIESYIEVSWGPMLSCLSNSTPLCLGRNHSPLSKFESEFHKTYTTQKLWKVPDPELRKRLRKAVIQKIIPEYTRFIEDCKVTNPKFTPQELAEMLQELFEG